MKKLVIRMSVFALCSFLLTGCGVMDLYKIYSAKKYESQSQTAMQEYEDARESLEAQFNDKKQGMEDFKAEVEKKKETVALMPTDESGDKLFEEALDYYDAGDYESAIAKMKQAEVNGLEEYEMAEFYTIWGNACTKADMFEEAFEVYEKACELDPDSVIHIVNLAVAYRQSGDNEKAMELYQKALEIDPDYPELNSSIGTLYVIEGYPETAIPYFEKALEGDPTLGTTYGNAALAYAMTGDFETADRYLNKAIVNGYQNADIIKDMIDELR